MSETESKGRVIGVRHRVKRTAQGEARPTQLFIKDSDRKGRVLELPDDDAELDFVLGRFPISWMDISEGQDPKNFPPHHVKWRRLKKEEKPESFPELHLAREGKGYLLATKVPAICDGLEEGDRVAMILGGSGDRFAFALANRGRAIGAKVFRIPGFALKAKRPEGVEKEDDATTLANLLTSNSGFFYLVRSRDEKLIRVRETLASRIDAMKARIACEQRLRQRVTGEIFLSEEGQYPEGSIEAVYDARRASDQILQNLCFEEGKAERALTRACEELDVYQDVFSPIEGCGPMIASRIISGVGDIRKFENPAKLKAFMGVHVLSDGRFPRRRSGEVSNWHPDVRQALYLLSDQFNRRPASVWGIRLLEYKTKLRLKHPEPVAVETMDSKTREVRKVKRYTDGHIHKMAMWRTVTKFAEWLWKEWWKLEGRRKPSDSPVSPVAVAD